jgi:hypothetical protein
MAAAAAAAAVTACEQRADADPARVDEAAVGEEEGWLAHWFWDSLCGQRQAERESVVGVWRGLCLRAYQTRPILHYTGTAAHQQRALLNLGTRSLVLKWRRAQTQLPYLPYLTLISLWGQPRARPKRPRWLSLRRIACQSPLAFRARLPAADSVSCLRSADHRSIDNICHPRTFPLLPRLARPTLSFPDNSDSPARVLKTQLPSLFLSITLDTTLIARRPRVELDCNHRHHSSPVCFSSHQFPPPGLHPPGPSRVLILPLSGASLRSECNLPGAN